MLLVDDFVDSIYKLGYLVLIPSRKDKFYTVCCLDDILIFKDVVPNLTVNEFLPRLRFEDGEWGADLMDLDSKFKSIETDGSVSEVEKFKNALRSAAEVVILMNKHL